MQGYFQVKLTGPKSSAEKFVSFLKEHEEGTPLVGFSGWVNLPKDFDQMKPEQEVCIYVDPKESGNISNFDHEEAFAKVAKFVPEMDMRASIKFFLDEEYEQIFLSPAGTSQIEDYVPIYCARCGKEITNEEMVPNEEGDLHCIECSKSIDEIDAEDSDERKVLRKILSHFDSQQIEELADSFCYSTDLSEFDNPVDAFINEYKIEDYSDFDNYVISLEEDIFNLFGISMDTEGNITE